MYTPIHFYLTFNPYLNKQNGPEFTQAHEFFEMLENIKKEDPNGSIHWGKMISKDRKSNIDLAPYLEVIKNNSDQGFSTHLYISDFCNLWVGKIESVKSSISKKDKTLSFYENKNVEIWFEISDFTILEYSPEETARKLSELYIDNKYVDLKIDEVSPFTSGVKFPVFVQDLADEPFFDEVDSLLVTQYHPAVKSISASKVIKSIHSFAFPEIIYDKIPHAAKVEIEMAELDILEQRHHSMGKIAFSYIKALEIVLNDLIIHHIKRCGFGDEVFVNPDVMPPKLFLEKSHDNLIPISKFQKNYSINQLIYVLEKGMKAQNFGFRKAFADKKQFIKYVTGFFSKTLKENKLLEIRGILAHGDSDNIDQSDAMAVRNLILGVGHQGLIHGLYQSFYHGSFDKIFTVAAAIPEGKAESKQISDKKRLKLVS